MEGHITIGLSLILVGHGVAMPLLAQVGPFDGKDFKGRIAFSSDGNFNDECTRS